MSALVLCGNNRMYSDKLCAILRTLRNDVDGRTYPVRINTHTKIEELQ